VGNGVLLPEADAAGTQANQGLVSIGFFEAVRNCTSGLGRPGYAGQFPWQLLGINMLNNAVVILDSVRHG
jgi:hypothetical protein